MDLQSSAIKGLLNDVNNFLAQTLSTEPLSENAQQERKALLQILALHLPLLPTPTTPPPYLDMNGTLKGEDVVEEYVDVSNLDDAECYEEFPEHEPPSTRITEEDNIPTPTINTIKVLISSSKLRESATKCGPLSRKGKLFFLDHIVRCWAGVTGNLLIVYGSEKDSKPCDVLHVQGYEARPAPSYYPKDPKKRESCFEIVCPGRKSYQFIARTPKDMEQWMSTINEASKKSSNIFITEERVITPVSSVTPTKRQLPSLPSSNASEPSDEYDDVNTLINQNQEDYDEEIYHNISEVYNCSNLTAEEEEIPLPPRRSIPKPPIEDTSDYDSVYDDVGSLNPDSFYYNVPGQNRSIGEIPSTKNIVKNEKSEVQIGEDTCEEEIYDDIGVCEKLPWQQKGLFHQSSTSSLGRIQNLIQKMESWGGVRNSSLVKPSHNNSSSAINITSEELYEPIDSPEKDNENGELSLKLPPRTKAIHL